MSEVLLILAFVLILLPLAYAGFTFAPWVPTRKRDLARIVALVKKYTTNLEGEYYELGSGTGIVTIAMSKKLERSIIGLELFFPLYLYASLKNIFSKSKARFLWKDFFKQDLSDASVIYLFGTPKPLAGKLKEKCEKECRPGTIIISYVFSFPGWEPIEVHKPNKEDLSIFVYKMKTARDH